MSIQSYRDLQVWQKAFQLSISVYELTEHFPKTEIYGLTSQMRRAAVSIPSNIAEGRKRGSKAEFRKSLSVAFGSGAELETQIEISKNLPFGRNLDYRQIDVLLSEVMKMLNVMIAHLQSPTS